MNPKNQNQILPNNYSETLQDIKHKIDLARYQSFKIVNKETVKLYLEIGKTVYEKTENGGWGKSVVEKLSKDLQAEYLGVRGFSVQNIWNMRLYYLQIKDSTNLQTLSREIDFSTGLKIITKIKDKQIQEFYFKLAINERLSVRDIERKIDRNEYENRKNSQTNFDQTLDHDQIEKAIDQFKNSYNFDLLDLADDHKETQLETALVNNIVAVLAEFGGYFTFAGRQVILEQGGDQFKIDLLFYHRILKSLVVVELKAGEFKPEYAGKIQFYLNLVDAQLKTEDEKPSIGLIICKDKDQTRVEYTLKDLNRPIGVSTYSYQELPEKIAKYLPNASDLEKLEFL